MIASVVVLVLYTAILSFNAVNTSLVDSTCFLFGSFVAFVLVYFFLDNDDDGVDGYRDDDDVDVDGVDGVDGNGGLDVGGDDGVDGGDDDKSRDDKSCVLL